MSIWAHSTDMVLLVGTCSLTFREFCACGAPEFFGKKDPIASRWWIADIGNAFWSSLFLEEVKVRLASCLLKDRAHDWWK